MRSRTAVGNVLRGSSGIPNENHSRARRGRGEHELAEILVFSQQDAPIAECPLDNHFIWSAQRDFGNGHDIVARRARVPAQPRSHSFRLQESASRAALSHPWFFSSRVSSWARVSAA